MIAQDASKHPGSIIRIHLDGSIPKDNQGFEEVGRLVIQRFIKLELEILKGWHFLNLMEKFT